MSEPMQEPECWQLVGNGKPLDNTFRTKERGERKVEELNTNRQTRGGNYSLRPLYLAAPPAPQSAELFPTVTRNLSAKLFGVKHIAHRGHWHIVDPNGVDLSDIEPCFKTIGEALDRADELNATPLPASPTADTILPDSGEAYRTNAAVRAAVDEIVRSVSELECYTSPAGQPTLLQCTVEELSGILESVLSREVPALPASSATPTDYCHCPLKDENDTGDCERCGKKVEHVFTPALPAASPTAPPNEDALTVVCRTCGRLIAGAEAGSHAVWVDCKHCDPIRIRQAVREALTKLADWMRLEVTVAHVGHWIEKWRDKEYPSLPASAEQP